MKKFFFAVAVLMSTIVGVGMFSLPYAGVQSGFLIAAIFLFILTIIMLLVHLLYGEIVSRTKKKHRLVGYADYYLGKWGKRIVGVSVIIGFYGSLLVYIIVGGNFLQAIFSPLINISPIFFNLIFFIIGAIAIYFGIHLIAELDFLMSLFLILIIFLIFYFGFSQINIANFKIANWQNIFFPYGVILYSLAGVAAIPEIREILPKNSKLYKSSIVLGTIIPAILYILFMFSVIGLSGLETSPETITGLIGLLGKRIIFWGALFGFLACLTSFFVLGLSLKKTFWYDFKINKNLSWLLVCFIPLLFFILGLRVFVPIIILLGALFALIEGGAIVLIHKRAKRRGDKVPDYILKIPDILKYIIILIFVSGFIYTLVSLVA